MFVGYIVLSEAYRVVECRYFSISSMTALSLLSRLALQ
jgi:hypothetical protein